MTRNLSGSHDTLAASLKCAFLGLITLNCIGCVLQRPGLVEGLIHLPGRLGEVLESLRQGKEAGAEQVEPHKGAGRGEEPEIITQTVLACAHQYLLTIESGVINYSVYHE